MRQSVSACVTICGRPCRLVNVCAAFLGRVYDLRLTSYNKSDEHDGSKAAVGILLFCQGRSWRNVGEFRLELWVEKLLTATGTRNVWSFLGLRFTFVAVVACACVRHGSNRCAPNAEYAPTLLQTLLACCICGCSVV